MPPKAVVEQMKFIPKNSKRRVITSDDENDERAPMESPQRATNRGKVDETPSSVEWVQPRKPSQMTQQERERNIQKAVEHRKTHSSSGKPPKSIPKAARPKLADEDSDDGALDHNTPYAAKAALKRALEGGKGSKGGMFKSALLQEALVDDQEGELEAKRVKREEAAAAGRLQRVESRTFAGRTFNPSVTSPPAKPASSGEKAGNGVLLADIYSKGRSQLEAIELASSDDEVVVVRRPAGSAASASTTSRGGGTTRSGRSGRRGAIELEEGSGDDDGNNENSGSERGYDSDMDRSALQALANKVLQQCDAVSRNLRQSLIQWETGADDSVCAQAAKDAVKTSKHFAGSAPAVRDCVDLTSISTAAASKAGSAASNSSKQILYDEDIAKLCPDLSLKGYQLVGVNWLKLLHQHNVNGVLADDMGLGESVCVLSFVVRWRGAIFRPPGVLPEGDLLSELNFPCLVNRQDDPNHRVPGLAGLAAPHKPQRPAQDAPAPPDRGARLHA
jgi:hypothetical protein